MALDETDFPVSDSISVEMMQVGETLQNGSVTRAGFKLDKLGKSCNIVSVSYNEGEYCEQEDGARFTEPGRYDVEVCTKLGENRIIQFMCLRILNSVWRHILERIT